MTTPPDTPDAPTPIPPDDNDAPAPPADDEVDGPPVPPSDDPPPPGPEPQPSPSPPAAKATIVAAWIGAGAVVVAAIIGAVVAIGTSDDPSSPPSTSPPTESVSRAPSALVPPPAAKIIQARVINTGGIGVYKYEQPTNQSGKQYGPGEGELIDIVCQVRDGQPVTDPAPAPGQPDGWPVWNKLSDGFFVPDLYTDLAKEPGPTPPNGLPVC